MSLLLSLLGFGVIVLASQRIGQVFSTFKLPLISGYLFAGILAGPFVLNFIGTETVADLRFLDDLSLAFIAFAAGSELNLKEMQSHLKSIVWNIAGQLIAIFVLVAIAFLLIADSVPFLQEMSPNAQLAAALLAGAIMVARSPSSAIAVVNELRARGPFTRTMLGVTVSMDIVVVVFFAISTAVADILLTAESFNLAFILLIVIEIALSIFIGMVLARLINAILVVRINRILKIAFLLTAGYGAFDLTRIVRSWTHENLPFEVLLEPLLICLVASFVVTTYSRHRTEFLGIIEDSAPIIYVVFFTLVGDALQIDFLISTLSITLLIFAVRLTGLFIGSFVGGTIAGDPPQYNRLAWMAYITQAGIGLGLAREVVAEFPELGNEFATMVISVIVLSQLLGPPFLNFTIRRMGEAHLPVSHQPDDIRDALVFGIDRQSIALAQHLQTASWQVQLLDTDDSRCNLPGFQQAGGYIIETLNLPTMRRFINQSTDAVIAMHHDDSVNYRVCELAQVYFGVPRLIVRMHDPKWKSHFRALGAAVVDADTAIVNLLEQYTRAPQTTALLLHDDPNYEVIQIEILNPNVDGIALRDLRLPSDVLVLGIVRQGHAVVPHGHSKIRLRDELTLIGHPSSLEGVTVRLGY